jgi:ATP-dependent Clp protease ATP-binding subunit ClpC
VHGMNFTERLRKVLDRSRRESTRLKHEYIGTEHLLLGLIDEGESTAVAALQNLSVDFDGIRQMIDSIVKTGRAAVPPDYALPYTSRAKKVLELSMDEARNVFHHEYVGTEHLLLGLLREEKGIAAQVLMDAGLTEEKTRAEIRRLRGMSGDHPQVRSAQEIRSVWVEVHLADGSILQKKFPTTSAAIDFLNQQ